MSKVFLPQEPVKRVNGEWVPSKDTRSLHDFGSPVVCVPPGRMILSTAPTVMSMREKMRDFCDEDYVVGIGDPALIGIACALAANANRGKFKMLKWDNERRSYIPVEIDIFQRLG